MNSQQLHNRNQHPHLFLQSQSDKKSSRSKIELTHIHHTPRGHDLSNYTNNSTPSYLLKSQQPPASDSKERSYYGKETVGQGAMSNQLYLLMKEQIDIAVASYRQKMSRALKVQAQQIHKLSSVIAFNSQIIQKQQQIIKSLGRNDDFLSSTKKSRTSGREENRNSSKSPGKISLTQRKSVQKLINKKEVSPSKSPQSPNDLINSKIDTLAAALDDMEKKLYDYANRTREYFNRLKELQRKVNNEVWKRMKKCQQYIVRYITDNEGRIVMLSQSGGLRTNQARQVKAKVQNLTEEMKEMRSLISNLAQREFTYDSYQLDILKKDLNRIALKVNDLTKESSQLEQRKQNASRTQPLNNSYRPPQLSHSHSLTTDRQIQERGKQHFQQHQSELQRSYLSSLPHFEPRYYSTIEDRVKRSQQWEEIDRNSPNISDDDQFYFEESEADKKERELKLTKLCEILRKNGYRFPVRVEIDETGYLKECSTGIYILDEQDNGFELTNEEVSILQGNGIILI